MKKQIHSIVSLTLAFLTMALVTVTSSAACPLGKNDFDFDRGVVYHFDGNGEVSGFTRSDNWIDYASISGKKQDQFLVGTGKPVYQNRTGKMNRGVEMNATKAEVRRAFGHAPTVRKVTDLSKEPDDLSGEKELVSNVPVESYTYTYQKNGQDYNKTFYFNDEGRVCYILWWIQ